MKSALLVIDVQNEYFTAARPVTHPPGSLDNILKVMLAAHDNGLPVILVQHASLNPQAADSAARITGGGLRPSFVPYSKQEGARGKDASRGDSSIDWSLR